MVAALILSLTNTAVVPVPVNDDWWRMRHAAMVKRAQQGNVDLVFVGDSITNAFGGEPDTGENFHNRGGDTWDLYYGGRHALNLGISGDRTQHVLWRLDHGEMDNLSPKVVEIMIGTNNSGSNTADEIAEGVEAVVEKAESKAPKAKILLLAIFPRGLANSPERAKLAEVNSKLKMWARAPRVTFLDIGKVFLDKNGEIPNDVMPDKLHPFACGYRLWAMATEPTLARLLGEKPKSTANPMNSALVPVTQDRDHGVYDWAERHKSILAYNRAHPDSDFVFIGDSITHRFGGPPVVDNPNLVGRQVWEKMYGSRKGLNLGYGYDRTENVLWRIEQGELDRIHPKAVAILIGTNNMSTNTNDEVVQGILAVASAVHRKLPKSHILLLGILIRGQNANDPIRTRVAAVNSMLDKVHPRYTTFLDIGSKFLNSDGSISNDVMFDFLHPTAKGYQIEADAIEPVLAKWYKS